MSEGVTACIAVAFAGGVDGSFFNAKRGLAVSVTTFARRNDCDRRQCCGCRTVKKRNRNREQRPRHSRSFLRPIL